MKQWRRMLSLVLAATMVVSMAGVAWALPSAGVGKAVGVIPPIVPMGNLGSEAPTFESDAYQLYSNLRSWAEGIAQDGGRNQLTLTKDSGLIPEVTGASSDELGQELQELLDAGKVYSCLLADCPGSLFWHDKDDEKAFSYTYRAASSGGSYELTELTFTFAVEEGYGQDHDSGGEQWTEVVIPEKAKQALANAKKTAEEIGAMSGSDLGKLTAIKEAICDAVGYDQDAAAGNGSSDAWQMLPVFDEDPDTNVVCEGYAKAFQYLCDEVFSSGSTTVCYTVTGTMGGGTGEGPHMWNIVRMQGKYYLVDVTNCGEGSVGYPGQLFMRLLEGEPGEAGSLTYANSTYTACIRAGVNVTYAYDSDTTSLYENSPEILAISQKDAPAAIELMWEQVDTNRTYGDTLTFAVRANEEGAVLQGVAVEFSCNGQSLGQATTDADGVATLVYDTKGKGIPAGGADVVAEAMGVKVSKPVTIWPRQIEMQVTAKDRTFDGSLLVEAAVAPAAGAVFAGDELVVLADPIGVLSDGIYAGQNKSVWVNEIQLAGRDAEYYSTAAVAWGTVNIAPAPLSLALSISEGVVAGQEVALTVIANGAFPEYPPSGFELTVDDGTVLGAGDFDEDGTAVVYWQAEAGPHTFTVSYRPAVQEAYTAEDYVLAGFDIGKQSQPPMQIAPVGVKLVGDPAFTLEVTGGAADIPTQFAVVAGDATVDANGRVTLGGVGYVAITATKPANDLYNEAFASVTFKVEEPLSVEDFWMVDGEENIFASLTSQVEQAVREEVQQLLQTQYASQLWNMGMQMMRFRLMDENGQDVEDISAGTAAILGYPAEQIRENYTDYAFKVLLKPDGSDQIVEVPCKVGARGLSVTLQQPGVLVLAYRYQPGANQPSDDSSSGGGGSDSVSFQSVNYSFWDDVLAEVEDAADGTTLRVDAKSFDQMPYAVMAALRANGGVSMVISWDGGEDIVIPAGQARPAEAARVFYPLSLLEELYAGSTLADGTAGAGTVNVSGVNPTTGGVTYVTAPAWTGAGTGVTEPTRGLAESAEQAQLGIEKPYEPVQEAPLGEPLVGEAPASQEAASQRPGMNGGLLAVVAVLAAGAVGGGLWFWKKQGQNMQ